MSCLCVSIHSLNMGTLWSEVPLNLETLDLIRAVAVRGNLMVYTDIVHMYWKL